MRPSNNLENEIPSDTYRRAQLAASMYEISGPQFFRTKTGIQSGPNAFNESRFVMIFLINLGVPKL